VVILLMTIGGYSLVVICGYFINGYCWLAYWWLLCYKLLLDFFGYIITSYWYLFYCRVFLIIYHRLLLVIIGYFTLSDYIYFKLF
jgi:hypothetical protein